MKVGIKKFQEGGQMAPQVAPEAAPVQEPQNGEPQAEQGENPIMQIAQLAVQALQNQDCQAAMQVCQAFIQMIQQSQQQATPEQAPEGEPVYKKGGVLIKRIKK